MAVKKYKPTSPGRRFMTVSTFEDITKKEPEKSLLEPLKKSGGRNQQGRITVRHRGGGHKRMYRLIDFRRDKDGVPAKVASIEYDPNRSARIALLTMPMVKNVISGSRWPKVSGVVESGGCRYQSHNCLPLQISWVP